MHKRTPSSVMFEDFKRLGVSHIDAAQILYDTDYSYGGTTIGERLHKRTVLSRNFIHVEPGACPRHFFKDFNTSTQAMAARLLRRGGDAKRSNTLDELELHFRDEGAQLMIDALETCGIESAEYRNAIERIRQGDFEGERDRFLLYLMLFLVVGCSASTREAVRYADTFASDFLNARTRTPETLESSFLFDESQEEGDLAIGIVRIFDGMTMKATHGLHVLPQTREGATLGSSGCDITDVDAQVSRKHARIWKENSRWYIEGLGSTNGLAVISGADKGVRVVEPPKSKRPRDFKSIPYQLEPADTICLGQHTRFLVQAVSVQ